MTSPILIMACAASGGDGMQIRKMLAAFGISTGTLMLTIFIVKSLPIVLWFPKN